MAGTYVKVIKGLRWRSPGYDQLMVEDMLEGMGRQRAVQLPSRKPQRTQEHRGETGGREENQDTKHPTIKLLIQGDSQGDIIPSTWDN